MKKLVYLFSIMLLLSACGNNTTGENHTNDSVIVPSTKGDTGNAGTSGSGNASGMQNANDKDNNYGDVKTNAPDSSRGNMDSTTQMKDSTRQ